MFWDDKFKYVKNPGEMLNSQGLKNKLTREIGKAVLKVIYT